MWDFLKTELIHFWPWIVIVAMMCFFFVSILVVARLEKHYIHQYEPASLDELQPLSPYFRAMNDAARAMGFRHCGDYVQSRGSSVYKCCLSLWLTADENCLLMVFGGKLARIDYKKTLLISAGDDETAVVTVDDFGLADLSGIRKTEVILNADLQELTDRHLQRLAAGGTPLKVFSPSRCLQQYEDMERNRIDIMVSLGLAEFMDLSHSIWRYSFKGAWAYACQGYLKGLQQARTQANRSKKKRPGS
jgi:hypothetical protein